MVFFLCGLIMFRTSTSIYCNDQTILVIYFPRWFIFFYVWGVIWNCNILYHALIHCVIYPFVQIQGIDQVMRTVTGDYVLFRCYGLTRYHFDALFVLSLICVQVLRRCHECLLVSTFSDSRMSIVHFCLGMFFYSAVGLTALLHLEAGRYVTCH